MSSLDNNDLATSSSKRMNKADLHLFNFQIFSIVFTYLGALDLFKVKHLLCHFFCDGFIINCKSPKCSLCGHQLLMFSPWVQMVRIIQTPLIEMKPKVNLDTREIILMYELDKQFDVSFLCTSHCISQMEKRKRLSDQHFNSFYMFMHYDDVCETIISDVALPRLKLLDNTKLDKYYYVKDTYKIGRKLCMDKYNVNPHNIYSILKIASKNPGQQILGYYRQQMNYGVTQEINNTWTMVVIINNYHIVIKGGLDDEYFNNITICDDGFDKPVNIDMLNVLARANVNYDNLDYLK